MSHPLPSVLLLLIMVCPKSALGRRHLIYATSAPKRQLPVHFAEGAV